MAVGAPWVGLPAPRFIRLLALFVWALPCGCVTTPAPRVPPSCGPATVGVPKAEVERFVARIETGLSREAWSDLATLARLPVRVSSGTEQGEPPVRFLVASRAEWIRRAPRLFSAGGATASETTCTTAMVGIAGGRVWATAFQEGLAITAVNCRGCDEPGDGVEPVIDCVAGGRRFAVLRADGAPWLEVSDSARPGGGVAGGGAVEEAWGTGVCAHLEWSASVGGELFLLREATGCAEEEAPAGTVAWVEVEGGDAQACLAPQHRP